MKEASPPEPDLSVVIPVRNEQDNVTPLLDELDAVLRLQVQYEVIVVDDHSSDRTLEVLKYCKSTHKGLRILSHDRKCGQSSAIRSGVIAAKSKLIVTIDGDGQNDPMDILKLYRSYVNCEKPHRSVLVAGRRRPRLDSPVKRIVSWAANSVRRLILKDGAIDSGCGLKLLSRESFLRLPFFDNMHRFIPILMMREGYEVRFVEVAHRPRLHGKSKYGVLDRFVASLSDMFGVIWLKHRCSLPDRLSEH